MSPWVDNLFSNSQCRYPEIPRQTLDRDSNRIPVYDLSGIVWRKLPTRAVDFLISLVFNLRSPSEVRWVHASFVSVAAGMRRLMLRCWGLSMRDLAHDAGCYSEFTVVL